MKKRTIFIFILFLLLGTGIVQSAMPTAAQERSGSMRISEIAGYFLSYGGSYRLSSVPGMGSEMAAGDNYRLFRPALAGSGCCCIYLPCAQR